MDEANDDQILRGFDSFDYLTLKAFLISADSFEMTALSSAAVLHCLICLMTSLNFKFDIFLFPKTNNYRMLIYTSQT
jgi:hypothetical protein